MNNNKKLNIFCIFLAFFICCILIYILYSQIEEHYLQNDDKLDDLKTKIEPLFDNKIEPFNGSLTKLNNRNILEEINLYKGKKSYTINKQKIFLCLKNEKDEYYNDNMLLYVLIHEIAHVICDEIGHTDKFHQIFKELLDRAIKLNIYNPSIPIIYNYCNYNKNDDIDD
jgi:hypothetical protein